MINKIGNFGILFGMINKKRGPGGSRFFYVWGECAVQRMTTFEVSEPWRRI